MDSTTSLNGMQTRKKRVLPTRSRRGGPGVGSCDVDMMILETHKRKSENEPLIPADTPFLLTTDSAVNVQLYSDAEVDLNVQANERYFDRPEVLKSFREQLLIETPQYVHVADLPSVVVGGRFRPRGCGDNLVDTSDAAYEKRHRKYETFEKRLRLREKEKLKHEHYKLKERIEQLRSMDGSAFLSLPASSFPLVDGQELDNSDDTASSGHEGSSHSEGERRRKEMLDVALGLEERYRVLLPPRKTNANSWAEQDSRPSESEEREEPSKPDGDFPAPKDTSGLKLKIKLTPVPPTTTTKKTKQIILPPRPSPLRQATSQNEVEEPPPPSQPATPAHESDVEDVVDTSEVTGADGVETLEAEAEAKSPPPSVSVIETSVPPPSVPTTPMSSPEIAILDTIALPNVAAEEEGDEFNMFSRAHTSASPMQSPKRPRLSSSPMRSGQPADLIAHLSPRTISVPPRQISVPPIEFINTSISAPMFTRIRQQKQRPLLQRSSQKPKQPPSSTSPRRETTGQLMTAAIRSSVGTKSRNTMRSVTAFGVKVPQMIEELRDFELPIWLLNEEGEDDEGEEGSPQQTTEDEQDTSDDDEPLAEIIAHGAYLTAAAAPTIERMILFNGYLPQPPFAPPIGLQGLHPPIETLDIPESSIRDVP